MEEIIDDASVSSYKKNGFLICKSIFKKREMDLLINDIHQVFKIRMKALGISFSTNEKKRIDFNSLKEFFQIQPEAYIGCMIQVQNLFSVFQLLTDIRIKKILHTLGFESPVIAIKPIIMMMNKKTSLSERSWKSPPHQDWRDIEGSLNSTVLWISVDKTDSEVGPIEVVPGSHKFGLKKTVKEKDWNRIPFDKEFKEDMFVSVPLDQGDLVIFSTFVIHRSGHNDSNRHRLSLQFRYNDMMERTYCERSFPNPYAGANRSRDYVSEGYEPAQVDILTHFL